jgi:hypothetical protein
MRTDLATLRACISCVPMLWTHEADIVDGELRWLRGRLKGMPVEDGPYIRYRAGWGPVRFLFSHFLAALRAMRDTSARDLASGIGADNRLRVALDP